MSRKMSAALMKCGLLNKYPRCYDIATEQHITETKVSILHFYKKNGSVSNFAMTNKRRVMKAECTTRGAENEFMEDAENHARWDMGGPEHAWMRVVGIEGREAGTASFMRRNGQENGEAERTNRERKRGNGLADMVMAMMQEGRRKYNQYYEKWKESLHQGRSIMPRQAQSRVLKALSMDGITLPADFSPPSNSKRRVTRMRRELGYTCQDSGLQVVDDDAN